MRKEKRVKKKLKMRTRKDEEDLKQHVGLSDSSYVDVIYWTSHNGCVSQYDDILLLGAGGLEGILGRKRQKQNYSGSPTRSAKDMRSGKIAITMLMMRFRWQDKGLVQF